MTLSHETAESKAAARETMKHDVPNFFIMKIHFIGSREGGQARPGKSILKIYAPLRDNIPCKDVEPCSDVVVHFVLWRYDWLVLITETGAKT